MEILTSRYYMLNVDTATVKQYVSDVCIKREGHPKMKIWASLTHPSIVKNVDTFLCSGNHRGRYLEECT